MFPNRLLISFSLLDATLCEAPCPIGSQSPCYGGLLAPGTEAQCSDAVALRRALGTGFGASLESVLLSPISGPDLEQRSDK